MNLTNSRTKLIGTKPVAGCVVDVSATLSFTVESVTHLEIIARAKDSTISKTWDS